ncbi:craniofacial development protein 2-like [Mytilus edulis]|uniref:craniofacial development protein 2-like n=1 Tax=Mytilus edulis TaxID=6550 RepID=UPI0039F0D7A3
MNAKVGNDNLDRERVMGKHGLGTINENGELLVDFCGDNDLVIGGTLFPHKNIHKITWNSPNGRDKNQIDHLMINGKWKNSLCDVRAMRGADCGSDHHLICGKIRLKLRKAVKNRTNKREIFDTVKLKQPDILKKFKIELRNRFQVLKNLQDNKPSTVESLEQGWSRIEAVFKETSRNTLGLRQRERKKWISDDTWTSIQQRKDIKTKLNSTKSERIQTTLRKEYSVKDKEVKCKAKADKAIYLETLAKEAETAASKGELSTVYKITKELSGKHTSSSVPCKSKDGKILASES